MKHRHTFFKYCLLAVVLFPFPLLAHGPWMNGASSDSMGYGDMGNMNHMGGGMMNHMGGGMMNHMGGGMMNHMGGGMMNHMGGSLMGRFRMLDLSDEQFSKLNRMQTNLQKQHLKLMEKILDAQANLREVWRADKPNAKEVGAAYDKLFQLRRQTIEARVETMNQMYDALTDDQRTQLKTHRRHRHEDNESHSPRHGGGHMMMQ